jgi:hypothetical protein
MYKMIDMIVGSDAKKLISTLKDPFHKDLLRDYLFSYHGTGHLMQEHIMTDALVDQAPDWYIVRSGEDSIIIECDPFLFIKETLENRISSRVSFPEGDHGDLKEALEMLNFILENRDLDVSIAIVAVICDWLKETDGIENDLGLFNVIKMQGKINVE